VQRNAIEAEIKIKEALLQRQELDIDILLLRHHLTDKLVKSIQEGQLIQPGQTLAFLVNRAEEKWVIANFKKHKLKNLESDNQYP
jgi:membrane fusion protein (multidrug efflux system)